LAKAWKDKKMRLISDFYLRTFENGVQLMLEYLKIPCIITWLKQVAIYKWFKLKGLDQGHFPNRFKVFADQNIYLKSGYRKPQKPCLFQNGPYSYSGVIVNKCLDLVFIQFYQFVLLLLSFNWYKIKMTRSVKYK